jgi:phage baseplate assembly protein W
MPVQRISKGFKDLSMSFEINPINSDLITVKNETAIARSVRNLILTSPGERFFEPELGSRVRESIFENINDQTASAIKEEIKTTISRFEPRVKLKKINCIPDYEGNAFNVVLVYDIIGIDVLPQQLEFALQPTR